ncbi:MAG: nucleotidyltransferase substrate binding protein [Oligoflexia bacterium]|nr:nucleotidyltransferase substrate binding protein [Oligoflexia bacterium]
MNTTNEIRWRQRFQNFEQSYLFLSKSLETKSYNDLEIGGLIKAFEFTFELAWKTVKDYLDAMGDTVKFPREVIKEGFKSELIEDRSTWIEMLDKRNELSHTYDRCEFLKIINLIRDKYFVAITQVYIYLKNK